LDSLLDFMRRCQDELVGPAEYLRYVQRLERGEIPLPRVATSKKQADLGKTEILERCQEIARVFGTVEDMLREENLGTFGHMITRAYELLKADATLFEEECRRTRFLMVDENPPVFGQKSAQQFAPKGVSISYQRTPLESLREEESKQQGKATAASLVEIVLWGDKDVEAADLAYRIQKKRKERDKETAERCRWSDFAVLYRQHNHRDELVKEFTERGIPFSIEGLDVLDTPEVRDVVACLTAAVSPNDAASLFRVAALPQFGINPTELRAAMRAMRRQELDLRTVLGRLAGGPAVLEGVETAHREIKKDGVRAGDAAKFVVRHFDLQPVDLVDAFLKFAQEWHTKATTETGSPAEFLEYVDYFVEANGKIELPRRPGDAVQLLTAHSAKGLEYRHVAIIRGSSVSFPSSYRE